MPARSFRVTVQNNSGFYLRRTALYIDHGELTDGSTEPAALVAPGESCAFQYESHGVATGVDGVVTYDVTEFQGDQHGSFYMHFTAPWVGNNHWDLRQSAGLIVLRPNSADYDVQYGGGDPVDFSVDAPEFAPDDNDGDGHSDVVFQVHGLEAGFQSPPPKTYAAISLPLSASTWGGQFDSDGGVEITVVLNAQNPDRASVTVNDPGQPPRLAPLNFAQEVDLTTPATRHVVLTATRADRGSNVQPRAASGAEGAAIAHVSDSTQKADFETSARPRQAEIRQTSEVFARRAIQRTISVGPDVELTLLWQIGAPVGAANAKAVRYQRFGVDNALLVDTTCQVQLPPPR